MAPLRDLKPSPEPGPLALLDLTCPLCGTDALVHCCLSGMQLTWTCTRCTNSGSRYVAEGEIWDGAAAAFERRRRVVEDAVANYPCRVRAAKPEASAAIAEAQTALVDVISGRIGERVLSRRRGSGSGRY